MANETQGRAETERLLLVPWSAGYFDEFARVLQDPGAMQFISGGTSLPLETVKSITQRSVAMWDEHGYGPWAALDKQTGRWVGRIGLNLLADWPGPDKWEVGFELAPEFWGRGLATEGAREAIRFGWTSTPLPPDHQRDRRRASGLPAGHGEVRPGLPGRDRVPDRPGRLVRHRPALTYSAAAVV